MRAATNMGARILGAVLVVMSLLALSTPARAEVTVNSSVINFGTVAVGTRSTSVSITLTNNNSRDARFRGAWVSSSRFSYSGPSRYFSLRPRQSVTVSVSFRPDAAQAFTGALVFRGSNGDPITVALSGTGAATSDASADRGSRRSRRNGRRQSTPAPTPTTTSTPAPAPAPTVSAPSITSQPVNRTVIAGQTASFSVSVSGTAPFTYQWKKNDAAISGATSSSYTTPAATTSDSGAQFTVTVSNSVGSVTSNPAILTVNATTLLLSVNPGSLSFGNTDVDSSATRQVTLTNSGTGNVTLSGMSVAGAGFSASGVSSGQVLTPGQTATINISFQPVAAGSVTGSVTVASSAASKVVSLSGAGVQQVSHKVSLSWVRSTSTVSGYQVYSSQVSGGPYTKLTASAVSLPSFTDSSVQNGKTYYYVVTAVDAQGIESSYSNQASAMIQ